MKRIIVIATLAVFAAAGLSVTAVADGDKDKDKKDKGEYVIQIKDHVFIPDTLYVPSGKKIKLRVENLDKSPEEFESYDLNREKVVAGGRKITVFIGPLKPGVYSYFGEFNPKTAQGVIIAE